MPCTEAYREHIMYTFNGYCNILKHPMKNTPLRYAVRQLSSPMGSLPPPCYLCRRRTGKSFSFTFSGITHSGKSGKCTDAAGVRPGIKSAGLYSFCTKKWRCFHMENLYLLPYETIVRTTSGKPDAVVMLLPIVHCQLSLLFQTQEIQSASPVFQSSCP